MSYFVLADCNNFYVSCERLFNPKLENCPVIVLSNNDGCVVARSQEAKKIGIKMGEPFFKIRDLCDCKGVVVLSSNYRLYGDISKRIMTLLAEHAPEIEIYSIDEAFLKYSSSFSFSDLTAICENLKHHIKKCVGIPISLGIAQTKTLAKVANDLAKKTSKSGVFCITPETRIDILDDYPIGDVWGIGRRLSERLRCLGIFNAGEFSRMDPIVIRKKMGVVGERMIWELNGTSCLEIEEPVPKKSITCSRSFGRVVLEKHVLAEALSTYVNNACQKLRGQQSCAHALLVFLESQVDSQSPLRRYFNTSESFQLPTNDTGLIISVAKRCLDRIYHEGERYKKCGVLLLDLIPESSVIPDLFLGASHPKRNAFMKAADAINERFGRNKIFFGAMGIERPWTMKSDRRSMFNTTQWDYLAIAKA